MIKRKLPINFNGLWNNPNEKFTVRYKNISKNQQNILAKRIKELAKQTTLRKRTGPLIEEIEQALDEINPIIFSEYIGHGTWYRAHKVFSTSGATYIAGYRFQMLCQAIYLLTCRKKALNPRQITTIARLTNPDWEEVEMYVNQRLGLNPEEDERNTPIEDLGLEDIHRAGEGVERNNPINRNLTIAAGYIDRDENYDEDIEDEEEEHYEAEPINPTELEPPISSGMFTIRRDGTTPISEPIQIREETRESIMRERERQIPYYPNIRNRERRLENELDEINNARRAAGQPSLEENGIGPRTRTIPPLPRNFGRSVIDEVLRINQDN